MPVAAARPHTDAVVSMGTSAGLLIGRGKPPEGAGWQGEPGASTFEAYVALFPMTGDVDADLGDPAHYFDYGCQFTCVAATQEGAEAVSDAIKATFVNAKLIIPGRASYRGQLQVDRPASRDDRTAPPLHYAVLQITWRTQPA
ncbi:hypothetical protein [Actinomadura rudentiformis]|uniref:DUF3168 domain-containing protein n=1 Tax=Actinomadura rudentiformis TaxID=359158 RepID=A0A6H9YT61_9ACTN|nr:hypothetical protein [Actinomadura rudentiformis]KAB2347350.1 hypothetical protein F8566_20270 [Actinomadura rudentiformis]